jgi:hypothetical protein
MGSSRRLFLNQFFASNEAWVSLCALKVSTIARMPDKIVMQIVARAGWHACAQYDQFTHPTRMQ